MRARYRPKTRAQKQRILKLVGAIYFRSRGWFIGDRLLGKNSTVAYMNLIDGAMNRIEEARRIAKEGRNG
jgi:hypothetical protein